MKGKFRKVASHFDGIQLQIVYTHYTFTFQNVIFSVIEVRWPVSYEGGCSGFFFLIHTKKQPDVILPQQLFV